MVSKLDVLSIGRSAIKTEVHKNNEMINDNSGYQVHAQMSTLLTVNIFRFAATLWFGLS